MAITYEIFEDGLNKQIIMTEEDGTIRFVPIDEGNKDYQAYLKSLEENN